MSFAWTVPPLLAGHKTVTRRLWKSTHARTWRLGEVATAYDRSPRYKGRPVAIIRLTAEPYEERLGDAPDEDFEREGFAWLAERPGLIPKSALAAGLPFTLDDYRSWKRWNADTVYWVVRFELLEVL